MTFQKAIGIPLAMFFAGCATIFNGTSQDVSINSQPSGAQFTIIDDRNQEIAQGITPSTVNLERGSGYFRSASYHIIFEKPGFMKSAQPVRTSINLSYFLGNFFVFGGFLGLLVIDPLTGGMYKLETYTQILHENTPSDNK
ncbi:MAG: hypothetical protein E7K04_03085 [Helicobacter sp.]|nr:hypothetical protein [Helicobacter sp.]